MVSLQFKAGESMRKSSLGYCVEKFELIGR
jgi:hypothetical protein